MMISLFNGFQQTVKLLVVITKKFKRRIKACQLRIGLDYCPMLSAIVAVPRISTIKMMSMNKK